MWQGKSIKKRILSYTRLVGHTNRIARMIAATASMEFVSTATEPEALLLEANLIKQLKPRFNVLLRDDKSFPYILITADHRRRRSSSIAAPARGRATITAVRQRLGGGPHHQRAPAAPSSCAPARTAITRNRSRPCLLFQINACSGPCTGEVSTADYAELVREARAFLAGRSRAIKEELAKEMEAAAEELEFERAPACATVSRRCPPCRAAKASTRAQWGRGGRLRLPPQGGATCIEVFFFRTGQNWGNRAYYPRADRSLDEKDVLGPSSRNSMRTSPARASSS